MKRALAAHEATLISVNIFILEAALNWYKDQSWCTEDLIKCIMKARNALKNKESYSGFKEGWNQFKKYILDIEIEEKIQYFITNNKGNCLLQYLNEYSKRVTRLFTFIEATRSRNFMLHLDSNEDLVPNFVSMNRIKYRLYSAIYIYS